MELAFANFLESFPIEEELIVTNFISRCKELQISINASCPNISIPPIDFERAKKEAIRQATREESYTAKVKKRGVINWVKAIFGSENAYSKETRTRTYVDEEAKLNAEKNLLVEQLRMNLRAYCSKFYSDFIIPMSRNANQQLNRLVSIKESEYDSIKEALLNAESIKSTIDLLTNELIIIEAAKSQLSEFKLKY